MKDYIIVGAGLAGWALARELERHRKNFILFDPCGANSSRASAGVYNPVILKRFTLAWKAAEYLPSSLLTYRQYEMETGQKVVYPIPIYRKLTSQAEQNDWAVASARPGFERYMDGITGESLPGIEAHYGFGVMKNTGQIDVERLLTTACRRWEKRGLLVREPFDYDRLELGDRYVQYGPVRALRVVFAEGYGLKNNPYFEYLPLMGTKGEVLQVELTQPIEPIVKANVFLAPEPGRKSFLVGSTYHWTDKSLTPTSEARAHLTEKLQQLYRAGFRITGQRAGIRPTVKDRRPLLGVHPVHSKLFVLNGLGTRGVILAPAMAKHLFRFMEFGMPLPEETDIRRFE